MVKLLLEWAFYLSMLVAMLLFVILAVLIAFNLFQNAIAFMFSADFVFYLIGLVLVGLYGAIMRKLRTKASL